MMTPSTHIMRCSFRGLCQIFCQILCQICAQRPLLNQMTTSHRSTCIRELYRKKDFVSVLMHCTRGTILHILICKWQSSDQTKSVQNYWKKRRRLLNFSQILSNFNHKEVTWLTIAIQKGVKCSGDRNEILFFCSVKNLCSCFSASENSCS